jgi:hypothetical protein
MLPGTVWSQYKKHIQISIFCLNPQFYITGIVEPVSVVINYIFNFLFPIYQQ